jgi:hypothetical protein
LEREDIDCVEENKVRQMGIVKPMAMLLNIVGHKPYSDPLSSALDE